MSTAVSTGPASTRAAYVEQVMGLPVSIHLRGPRARGDATAAVVREAFGELRRADALFSTYRRTARSAGSTPGCCNRTTRTATSVRC